MNSDSSLLEEKPKQNLSGLAIAMIVLSTLAGIGLAFIAYLFIQRKKQQDIEEPKKTNGHPVTSSLDHSDMFLTILEYPPATLSNISSSNNNSSSMHSTGGRLIDQSRLDPISASLVRQSLEERAGYYKSPSRVAVPYYKHNTSAISNGSKDCMMTSPEDEDMKEIQRWSTSSYQVW